ITSRCACSTGMTRRLLCRFDSLPPARSETIGPGRIWDASMASLRSKTCRLAPPGCWLATARLKSGPNTSRVTTYFQYVTILISSNKIALQCPGVRAASQVKGTQSNEVTSMIRARESKAAPVGVVRKVLKIFEVLHGNPSGLPLKEIARRTAINKSTAYRFLVHLQGEGYLYRDEAGSYVIGPKLARMGSGMNFEESLRKMSRPVLQRLWTTTGETVNLAILDGLQILYLAVIESAHTFRFASQVGARRPLYCTALGKAILSQLPAEEVEDLLGSLAYERFTPHTITQP